MKIATFNANSIRSRIGVVTAWLAAQAPDVLCLQETKTVDEAFPAEAIEGAGYAVVYRGEKAYNGVALIATTAGGLSRGMLGLPPGVGHVLHRIAPPMAAAVARQKTFVERSRWSDSDLGLLLTRLYSFGSTATDQAARFVASMVASTPVEVVAEFLPALQEHDKHDALGVFQQVEVLVLVGATDRLTPRDQSEEIVRLVPGAEFVVIPDSGHMVTLEKPDQVDAHLLTLLARVRRDIAGEASDGAA